MDLYCIKCLMFTKNNNIKVKVEIDEKLISILVKRFVTIDDKDVSDLLKDLI